MPASFTNIGLVIERILLMLMQSKKRKKDSMGI